MNSPNPPGFPADPARTPPPFFKVMLLAAFVVVVGLFVAGQLIRSHYDLLPAQAISANPGRPLAGVKDAGQP
jgi:hypothetical protein